MCTKCFFFRIMKHLLAISCEITLLIIISQHTKKVWYVMVWYVAEVLFALILR